MPYTVAVARRPRPIAWGLALLLAPACAEGTGIDGSPLDPNPPGTTGEDTTGGAGTTTGLTVGSSESSTDESTTEAASSSGTTDDDDESSSSGTVGTTCGNGMLDGDEPCDGDEIGDVTCSEIDPTFTGGVPTCSTECTIDTTACITASNPYTHCVAVGQSIPDLSATGLTSSWTIPEGEAPGRVVDVNLRVQIDHTYVGDLVVDLLHGGTSVNVIDRNCASNDDLVVTFDDEAAGAIACLMTEVDATVRPRVPLTAFDGDATQAEWSLFVRDSVGGDIGTLQQWCITVQWASP